MNEQNPNVPQDMWPDDNPTPVNANPTFTPPSPDTPPPPSSFQPQPPKKSKAMAWSLIAAFLVLLVGVSGYYIWTQVAGNSNGEIAEEQPEETTDDQTQQPVVDPVSWQSRQTITSLRLLDAAQVQAFRPQDAKYYKVGSFTEGIYKDSDLILLTISPLAPDTEEYFYRFAKAADGKLTLLSKHSTKLFSGDGMDRARFSVDESYEIPSLIYPNRIENAQDSDQPLVKIDASNNVWFEIAKVKQVFSDPTWGDVYVSRLVPTGYGEPKATSPFDSHGFYLEAPDGTTRFYGMEIPFTNKAGVTSITWNDNQRNSEEYRFTDITGCQAAVTPLALVADLEKGGKSSNGDDIWTAKSTAGSQYLKSLHQASKTQMKYEEFISRNNLFFWKDFLGRTIKFQNIKSMAAIGCS